MNAAIEDLKKEHDAILYALGVLERMIGMIAAGSRPDEEDLPSLLSALEAFSEKCHQGKEEGLLFPALEAAGVARAGGPIGQMLREHEEGRVCLARMIAALSSREGLEVLARESRTFVSLLRIHIRKENEILFPMAERALGRSALDGIGRGFEEFEDKYDGAERHGEVLSSLARLERKYL